MYDEFLNFIFPLAKGAGEIQLAYFRGDDLGIETKSNAYDVVTRADNRSVDVPERVINRPDGIPERAVVSPRMNGGGR